MPFFFLAKKGAGIGFFWRSSTAERRHSVGTSQCASLSVGRSEVDGGELGSRIDFVGESKKPA